MSGSSVFQKQLCPCISLSSDSAMARQWLDPLKILVSDLIFSILAGIKKKYLVLNEFEIWPDCGISCPRPFEKFFYLLENYLHILADSQGSDRCPPGYLFLTSLTLVIILHPLTITIVHSL